MNRWFYSHKLFAKTMTRLDVNYNILDRGQFTFVYTFLCVLTYPRAAVLLHC
jgi:hypothetical protein